MEEYFELESSSEANVLRLAGDETNRLTRARVVALTEIVGELAHESQVTGHRSQVKPLIITGNKHFFSAGADLNEIAALTGAEAYEFAAMGQALMNAVVEFPAPTYAAVWGYCMGGGLDLALACRYRIAHPHAVFGHRGAALGLITGWGGTQRLPRLVGRAKAIEMFLAAEKVQAPKALEIGLLDGMGDEPVQVCIERITTKARRHEGI
ncbi:MAG: enoyl-CoA hydratase/isomerase family protein [Acidobacteriaceae bacterium]